MFLGLVIIYSRCKYFTLICVIKNLLAFYQVTIKTFKGGICVMGFNPSSKHVNVSKNGHNLLLSFSIWRQTSQRTEQVGPRAALIVMFRSG